MTPFIKALNRRGCIVASPDAPISEVIMLMAENNVGAIVITNKDAIVEGIVSERDIVREISIGDLVKRILEKYENEAEQMRVFINS